MHKARFLLMASLLMIGAGIAAIIILLPSYLILEKNRAALDTGASAPRASAANASDRDLLKHIQSRVDELHPLAVAASSSPSEAIAAALALRPAGISIDRINYSTGKTAIILLSGSSKSGDLVSAYQRALAGSDAFAGVSVPVGALAGVNDGHFSITIVNK